jgi:hypothetical protein
VSGVAVAAGAAGERFAVEFQVAGGSWKREPLSSCHGARFEDALPARPFRFEKGLQSFAGWWYFATTGTHVGFESWLERDHLMLMDFDPGVRGRLRRSRSGSGGGMRTVVPAGMLRTSSPAGRRRGRR